jgi:hypothetical protein
VPAENTPSAKRTRPLTSREQRNLEKIVKADFHEAVLSLRDQAVDWKASEETRLKEEFDAPPEILQDFARRARELQERFTREAEDFLAEVAREGFVPNDIQGNRRQGIYIDIPKSFSRTGYEAALWKSSNDANKIMRIADANLRTSENDTARKILLAGISTEAAIELLEGLPKPGEALALAIEAVRPHPSEKEE